MAKILLILDPKFELNLVMRFHDFRQNIQDIYILTLSKFSSILDLKNDQISAELLVVRQVQI